MSLIFLGAGPCSSDGSGFGTTLAGRFFLDEDASAVAEVVAGPGEAVAVSLYACYSQSLDSASRRAADEKTREALTGDMVNLV